MDMMKEARDQQHVFEKRGLGEAPFTYVGFEERKYQACADAPVQPGASCDYCGTPLYNCFLIRSSDGNQFVVGSECVNKTGDAGLRKAVKKELRAAQIAREEERIEAALKLWRSGGVDLGEDEGYVAYCCGEISDKTGMAGHSGRLRCARIIEKAAKAQVA